MKKLLLNALLSCAIFSQSSFAMNNNKQAQDAFTEKTKTKIAHNMTTVMMSALSIASEPYGGPVTQECKRKLLEARKLAQDPRYLLEKKDNEKAFINLMIRRLYADINQKRTALQK